MTAYSYAEQEPKIYSASGVAMLLAIRDSAFALLKQAGAARSAEIIRLACLSGDIYVMHACLDYLVKNNDLLELSAPHTALQARVFIRGSGHT